jgi:hypothetical protein
MKAQGVHMYRLQNARKSCVGNSKKQAAADHSLAKSHKELEEFCPKPKMFPLFLTPALA